MPSQRCKARLPNGATPPFRVWVNGVEQREGADYHVSYGSLLFDRELAKEGRLGFWRWTMMVMGIAGSYRKNDSVDVQYRVKGKTRLATGLELETEDGESSALPT